jgi:hypothetical protein
MYGFGNTGSGESAWVKPRAHLTTYNIDLSVYYVPGCVAARAYARSLRTATSVVSNYKCIRGVYVHIAVSYVGDKCNLNARIYYASRGFAVSYT